MINHALGLRLGGDVGHENRGVDLVGQQIALCPEQLLFVARGDDDLRAEAAHLASHQQPQSA
jgi:hypothetical protein